MFCKISRKINKLYHSILAIEHGVFRIYGILVNISDTLERIEGLLSTDQASQIEFYSLLEGQKRKVNNMNLKVSQKLPLSIEIKDVKGNPAKVDGAPQWSLTSPDLGSLEVAADGMSAVLSPAGSIGSLVVQVNADADLGEGVKNILGELPVELLAGDAVSISISAGAPENL